MIGFLVVGQIIIDVLRLILINYSLRPPANTGRRPQLGAYKGSVLLGTRLIYTQPAASADTPQEFRVRFVLKVVNFLIVVLGSGLHHVERSGPWSLAFFSGWHSDRSAAS